MRLFMVELSGAWMAIAAVAAAIAPEDDRIVPNCVLGSIAGSIAYCLVSKRYEQADVMAVLLGNFLLGFIFSPLLVDALPYLGLVVNYRSCVALGGSIGLLAPWICYTFMPKLGKKIISATDNLSAKLFFMRLFKLKPEDLDDTKDR